MDTSSPWTGMVPVDDTALHTIDSGGPGAPVVYLNGSFANLAHWDPVVADLGDDGWRHVRYDERGRGRRSLTSSDYSFEATIRGLEAVLTAREIDRPILVGWSYGVIIAMHWADRHPDRVTGVVSVDGALPVPDEMYDPEFADRVRRGFRRARLLFPVLNRFGLAGRMTAEQHAEINLDVLQYQTKSALEPILDRVECPVRYLIGAGGHTGTNDAEMAPIRAGIEPVLRRRPNFEVTARVPVNHEKIVKKCHPEIAQAVREVAAAVGQERR